MPQPATNPLSTPWTLPDRLLGPAFALAYFAFAWAGKALSFEPANFVAFWPPSGLFAAALLCTEKRRWPVLILAAALANLAFDLLDHKPLLVALGFTLANGLEALSGAWLVRRLVPQPTPGYLGMREFFAMLVCSALLGPALGALVGTAVVAQAFGVASPPAAWLLWWSTDSLSVLVLGLGLVALHRYGRDALRTLSPARWAEFLLVLALLLALAAWLASMLIKSRSSSVNILRFFLLITANAPMIMPEISKGAMAMDFNFSRLAYARAFSQMR